MSKSKQKGTAFERLVADYFDGVYLYGADRRVLAGVADKGDIAIPGEHRFVVECKHVARLSLSEWFTEAEREAGNAGVPWGVVVHKRKGKGKAEDQWVTLSLGAFLALVAPPGGSSSPS